MSKDYEYLSEKELNDLINSVETEGCVQAPEDMTAEILRFVDEAERVKNSRHEKNALDTAESSEAVIRDHKTFTVYTTKDGNSKKLDFALYCVKVFGSIAAAIIIMVIVPFVKKAQPLQSRDEIVASYATESREEVLSHGNVRTKEEVLQGNKSDSIISGLQSIIDNMNYNWED